MSEPNDELVKRVQKIHGAVMEEFLVNPCEGVPFSSLKECIAERLSKHNLRPVNIQVLNIDGAATDDPNEAKYVRAVCSEGDVDHIFTFALVKRRGLFNVIFMQSAVSIK